MRLLLFLLALLITQATFAQDLQMDSTTGKYTYKNVVPVDSVSADVLFDRALQWIAFAYKSANAVIQYQDKATGKIIAKGHWIHALPEDHFQHTLIIEVKDGKARYTFTDFVNHVVSGVLAGTYPLEARRMQKKIYMKSFYIRASSTAEDLTKALKGLQTAAKDDW